MRINLNDKVHLSKELSKGMRDWDLRICVYERSSKREKSKDKSPNVGKMTEMVKK